MQKPLDVVLEFFDHWGPTKAALKDSMRTYLTEDAVWENVGIARTVGIEEAIGCVDAFNDKAPFEYITVEMIHAATSGDAVLTERIDHFHAADGTILSSLRMMGVFELRGGKIAAWRDYYDTAGFV